MCHSLKALEHFGRKNPTADANSSQELSEFFEELYGDESDYDSEYDSESENENENQVRFGGQ